MNVRGFSGPSDEEVQATIDFLTGIYPNQMPPNLDTFERVLRERAEAGTLLDAAETWWAEPRFKPGNKFWPTPADLLEIAEAQGQKPVTKQEWFEFFKPDLAERLQVLKNRFAFEDHLDEREWQQLAEDYKARGGHCAAADVMEGYRERLDIQNGIYKRRIYENLELEAV